MGELHVVIAAHRDPTDPDAVWTYRAVSAPQVWRGAIEEWDRLDARRRAAGGRVSESYYMVRAFDDPRWRFLWLPHRFTDTNPASGRSYRTSARVRAAIRAAELRGFVGRQGGWIYNRQGKPVAQGWWEFSQTCTRNGWILRGDDLAMYVPALAQPEPSMAGAR
jgi:hypothetical protein